MPSTCFELNTLKRMILKTNYLELWGTAYTMPRGKFITPNAYLRNEERLKIDQLSYDLQKLEKKNKLICPPLIEGRKK